MSKLIMLKGLGINGKSWIVDELMKIIPEIIHLPQTNREYFKIIKSKNLHRSTVGITEFYIDKLKSMDWDKDATYITERSPLDYYLNFRAKKMNNPAEDKPRSIKMSDGSNFEDYCFNAEVEFLNHFDEVIIFELHTLDLIFLKDYLNNGEGFHKDYYHTRGYYISLQDRWINALNPLRDKFYKNDRIKTYQTREMFRLTHDTEEVARLLARYVYNLFR